MFDNVQLLVDTVARVQGITKDVVIFMIPNCDAQIYSFKVTMFNVATSRAIYNTFIITDKDVMAYKYMDNKVRTYIDKLVNN